MHIIDVPEVGVSVYNHYDGAGGMSRFMWFIVPSVHRVSFVVRRHSVPSF
jgi:hypothetical protein